MELITLIGVIIGLWVLLIPFTSYCIVDSNRPTDRATWSAFLIPQILITSAGALAFYFYSTQSEYTLVTTMLCVGLVFGAAAIDPTKVSRDANEPLMSFGKRFFAERFRRAAISQVVVFMSAALATFTFPKYWYMAVYLVVLHLHYYKMASCIAAEAGTTRPQDAPEAIRKKWAWRAVPAAIVVGFLIKGPHTVFDELSYVAEKWNAFGGFTLMSAAFFLAKMLVRSDA